MKKNVLNMKLGRLNILNLKKIKKDEYSRLEQEKENQNLIYNEYTDGDFRYYYIETDGLSEQDIDRAIQVKQIEQLDSMRKMMKFFVVLTIINLVATVIFSIAL